MNLTIGSFKCRVEICILIVFIFWLMFGHLLCSCSKVGVREGFDIMATAMGAKTETKKKEGFANIQTEPKKDKKEGFLGFDFFKKSSDKNKNGKEEFTNGTSSGYSYSDSNANTFYKEPSTWSDPTPIFSTGAVPNNSSGYENINNRPSQPIPLPEGQMDMFATTPFKPECCPSEYSNSSGCACMTVDQYKYLGVRGGNNVPRSDY